MGTCKTKTIQADLSKFRNYSGIFRAMCKPGIFKILAYREPEAYPEPWYIQNSGYLETWHIQNSGIQNQRHTYSLTDISSPCKK